MKRVTAGPISLIAVKVASTAGVFYTTERLWKNNRVAAVVFMVGANSAMAWVCSTTTAQPVDTSANAGIRPPFSFPADERSESG
jgi:hypothetical protein